MKVTVIGGGSTYTPELIQGFLERSSTLPVSELWLMDIDPARLDIVGGFARRIVEARGNPFTVKLTTDQRAAVQNASYVITQLRVGQMPARVADEYLGLRHGLIGQETTGVGGMAKAMRTIPVILKIAADMRELKDHTHDQADCQHHEQEKADGSHWVIPWDWTRERIHDTVIHSEMQPELSCPVGPDLAHRIAGGSTMPQVPAGGPCSRCPHAYPRSFRFRESSAHRAVAGRS